MMLATGHGNFVPRERVVGVAAYDKSQAEFVEAAKRMLRCMDHTGGRAPRSIVYLDTGQIALSSLKPEALRSRMLNAAMAEN